MAPVIAALNSEAQHRADLAQQRTDLVRRAATHATARRRSSRTGTGLRTGGARP